MLNKSIINELTILFPESRIFLYSMNTDTDITKELSKYVIAYIKQSVSSNLSLYVLVFSDKDIQDKFNIFLYKSNIKFDTKSFSYRTKALFNSYLKDNAEIYNIPLPEL